MYGRTLEQDTLLVGRRALSRHYYGMGRWGNPPPPSVIDGWTVKRRIARKVNWAIGSGGRARKIHAVKYWLTARDKHGRVLYLTVWQCGGSCNSRPIPQSHPKVVCAKCAAALTKVTEVAWKDS